MRLPFINDMRLGKAKMSFLQWTMLPDAEKDIVTVSGICKSRAVIRGDKSEVVFLQDQRVKPFKGTPYLKFAKHSPQQIPVHSQLVEFPDIITKVKNERRIKEELANSTRFLLEERSKLHGRAR